MKEYSQAEKAEWILKHGAPRIQYVYEKVNNIVFRRVSRASENLPPWEDVNTRVALHTLHEFETQGGTYGANTPREDNAATDH